MKFEFECYYCNHYKTNVKQDYERHVVLKHSGKPCYPSKVDLERLGLKAQGKSWDIVQSEQHF
jgi:proteasome lid subunit RPN8/RPN11